MSPFRFVKANFNKIEISMLDKSKVRVVFPKFIGDFVDVGLDGVDWASMKKSGSPSAVMWKHSLSWVGSFFCNDYDRCFQPFIDSSIKSYLETFHRSPETFTRIPSSDHACAFRITASLLWLESKGGLAAKERFLIEPVLYKESVWLIEKVELSKRKVNNHAVMSLMAVLNFIAYFGETDKLKWSRVLSRLKFILEVIFDKDGYANENTVGYHVFNVKLIQELYHFLLENNLESIGWLSELVAKSEELSRALVWQNGEVPPIGDSHVYDAKILPINKSVFLPESGFAVIKNDSFYLSLICGFRHISHKHVDDTSFTWRVNGVDYITDGGLYNYNQKDRRRAHLLSSKSHSGFFPVWLDDISREEYIGASDELGVSGQVTNFFEVEGKGFVLRCKNIIRRKGRPDYYLERIIFGSSNSELSIFDRFELIGESTGTEDVCSIRFVLPSWVDQVVESSGSDGLLFKLSGKHDCYSLEVQGESLVSKKESLLISRKKGQLIDSVALCIRADRPDTIYRSTLTLGSFSRSENRAFSHRGCSLDEVEVACKNMLE